MIPENEGDVACRSQLAAHRSVRRHVLDPPLQGDRAWPSGLSISALSWEPSWEPFSLDWCGRRWTPVEPEASSSSLYGHPWTSVDTAWRSTDQEVGCSSRPGRAIDSLAVAGDFTSPMLVEGFEQCDLWEPFARSASLIREVTPATDTHSICRSGGRIRGART